MVSVELVIAPATSLTAPTIGALQMSLSYRLNRRLTLINSFEFGVTSDAPDMRLTIRAPYSF